MKSIRVSFIDLFNTRRLVVAVMLGVLICFWAFFYLPTPVIDWISARAAIAGNILLPVFALLGMSALSFLVLYLIGEPLVHGTSGAALFYQAQFPSKRIAADYGIDI